MVRTEKDMGPSPAMILDDAADDLGASLLLTERICSAADCASILQRRREGEQWPDVVRKQV